MYDRIQVRSTPSPILFYLLQLSLMCPIEYSIAGNMKPLFLAILLDTPQRISVVHTCRL